MRDNKSWLITRLINELRREMSDMWYLSNSAIINQNKNEGIHKNEYEKHKNSAIEISKNIIQELERDTLI